jgi:hypothetical protein
LFNSKLKASEARANAPTGPRKARPDDKLRAAPKRSFSEADQQIAAAVGGRTREENAPPSILSRR